MVFHNCTYTWNRIPFNDDFPLPPPHTVPSQPLNFVGYSLSPKQIRLVWTAPQVAREVTLEEYLLRYQRADQGRGTDEGGRNKNMLSLPADRTSYVLDHLLSNTTYHVSLAAKTKYGMGIAAQIKVLTESNGELLIVTPSATPITLSTQFRAVGLRQV